MIRQRGLVGLLANADAGRESRRVLWWQQRAELLLSVNLDFLRLEQITIVIEQTDLVAAAF